MKSPLMELCPLRRSKIMWTTIRSLSLNQTSQDPRTLNAQGVEQGKLSKKLQTFDDLIAQ